MLRIPSHITSNLSKCLLFLLGNSSNVVDTDQTGARPPFSPSNLPRHRSNINDNYCAQSVTGLVVPACVTGQMNASVSSVVTNSSINVTGKDYFSKTRTQLPVFYHVASHVPFAGGLPQKKGIIPEHRMSIKSVKGVSCVDQLSPVQNVTNVPIAVPNPPVGLGLHEFGEKCATLGVSPKVVTVLREGYTLPFRSRPYLTRKPTVTSCYVDAHRNSYLLEALH